MLLFETFSINKKTFQKNELIDIIEMIKTFSFENTHQSLLHGDLYCRHIIVDEKLEPTGLIDFGDMFFGDPGIDLSAGMIFSQKSFATLKATSASKRAVLISFTVSSMSFSDKRPLVRKDLKVEFRRSDSC